MKLYGFELNFRDDVYQPREDTYLFADYLENLPQNDRKVLEIGTGTGILALLMSEKSKKVIGADVNDKAVKLARKNAEENHIKNTEFKKSDLFQNLDEKFDLIIFNPPYLPGNRSEDNLDNSEQWHGGKRGRHVIERFAKNSKKYLRNDGRILLIISSLTGFDEVRNVFKDENFDFTVLEMKKLPWERLFLVEIS